MSRRVAVVGAGWAGLAATVRATQAGHAVTLFEMAGAAGGRARSFEHDGQVFDCGQHILIGAYSRSLDLMRTVDADPEACLLRLPLTLRYPDGRGMSMGKGPQALALGRALAGFAGWSWRERAAMLWQAARWAAMRFRCDERLTVDQLCIGLPVSTRRMFIEPLCVAALNTPASQASASVFLRVLHDAMFSGPGSSDLLLPRRPLDALLAQPAMQWLRGHGADVQHHHRVMSVERHGNAWRVDERQFDAVILACSTAEASRLSSLVAPAWAEQAAQQRFEPIVTVYLHHAQARMPSVMLALAAGPRAPAQFVFDHGQLHGRTGLLACVVSGAGSWLEGGIDALCAALLAQMSAAFGDVAWSSQLTVVFRAAEKRATFSCTPQLKRPTNLIVQGLLAAGDYIVGPYPATLEGAVLSGERAAGLIAA